MALRSLTPELVRRWKDAGLWTDRLLHEAVDATARQHPDRLAIADQHDRWSYGELVARSSSLARWLLGLDLPPGSAVALQAGNRAVVALAHLACNRAGFLFVPLSTAWRRAEMEHLLASSGAAVVVVPPATAGVDHLAIVEDLRGDLPALRAIGVLEGEGGEFTLAEVATPDDGPWVAVPGDPDVGRLAMATSGTTELPRMSLWTDNNLHYFLGQWGRAIELTESDVAVGIAPANTGSTGYVFPVLAPLLHGASSVLLERWKPDLAVDLLEREGATVATAIPTQIIKMLQDPSVGQRDYRAFRAFNNAGAPLSPAAAQELEEVFGCTVQTVYGASDGGVPVMTRVGDDAERRYRTVGRPLPETDLRIVDPEMHDVPPGTPGEVIWRNPSKHLGYLNEPERSEEMFWDDGYYRSGDIGVQDGDGYLRIVGRLKDLIIRGGQNISPREVEELIASEPSVSEVAVVGIPDPVYGERACACVVLRPGAQLDLEQLVAFLDGHQVARYKRPERLEVFDELPKSSGAKVSKVALREAVLNRPVPVEG